MDLSDKPLPCDACGGSFVWPANEQAFFLEKGFNPPRRCTGARKARKANGQTERYEACPFGASEGPARDFLPRPARRFSAPASVEAGFKNGSVVKVIMERGFGFVRDEEANDYYFHQSDVLAPLARLALGVRVTFDAVAAPRGLRAQNVQVV